MIKFQMPNLGADMEAGTLVEWRKQLGDYLKRGDIIADVETQKGLIEIEVFEEGILEEFLVREGEKVPVGTVMALINDGKAEETAPDSAAAEIPKEKIQPSEDRIEQKEMVISKRVKISPLARKIAEVNGIDISKLKGTGPEGSIVKEDVEAAISSVIQTPPESVKEEIPAKSVSPSTDAIRMAVASAMSKSNREIPHYYLEKRIDLSKALTWTKEANRNRPIQKRLLPAALFIKAVAKALDEVPDLNATWENGIQRKNEINIGFVVSLRSGGIVVPAILQVDAKSVDEIMETLNDLIPRARAFKLKSSELSQSTFTITNIGEGGADKVFGLIYPPQVGILGFGEVSEQPFAEDGMLGIRPVVNVTLAADHRATDGLIGSRFLASLNKHLQTPESL
jgi:pyruvate dehydrogenase E2 component (dihydrolipoamide acetyltransferase)